MDILALFAVWFASLPPWALYAFIAWSIAWEGWALWTAGRNRQKWWFILLLLVHTLGILDIIYIFYIGRPTMKKRLAAQAGEAGSSVLAK